MPSPNKSPLDRLQRLDRTAPDFPQQILTFLYSREYEDWVKRIRGADRAPVALGNYVDEVRCRL